MSNILFARWVLPIEAPPIENGFVKIEDGRIAAVGRVTDLSQIPSTPPSGILTPGLINLHTHLELTFPQPIPANGSMADWLFGVIAMRQQFPDLLPRIHAGIQQLLADGVTTVCDISSQAESLKPLADSGLRAWVALEFFHPGHEAPLHLDDYVSRYRQITGSTKHVQLCVSPHAPYNVSPSAYRAVVEALQPPLVHTHLAECRAETQWVQGHGGGFDTIHQRFLGQSFLPEGGPSPSAVQYWASALRPPMLAAHCVDTTEEDRQFLQQTGVGVAHCPRSNLFLHDETLSWADWQGYSRLGLGTDSTLSCPDLSVRAEALAAMALHGWTPEEALWRLTLGGAHALGQEHALGSLSPGKWADLAWWPDSPDFSDPHQAVLQAVGPVGTWVSGEPLDLTSPPR
jgi:cytosine/adenosine deaminase-related metal-dependent hydrolase